jgi:hypothetical protein
MSHTQEQMLGLEYRAAELTRFLEREQQAPLRRFGIAIEHGLSED